MRAQNRKNKRSYMKHHKVFSICNIREHNKVNCIQLEMWETNVRKKYSRREMYYSRPVGARTP